MSSDLPAEGKRGEASERAVEAAVRAAGEAGYTNGTVEALRAAHSPALGEDRSVRLGDVLDALRRRDARVPLERSAADFIAREFSSAEDSSPAGATRWSCPDHGDHDLSYRCCRAAQPGTRDTPAGASQTTEGEGR